MGEIVLIAPNKFKLKNLQIVSFRKGILRLSGILVWFGQDKFFSGHIGSLLV